MWQENTGKNTNFFSNNSTRFLSVKNLDPPAAFQLNIPAFPEFERVKVHSRNIFFLFITTKSLYNPCQLYDD